MRTCSEFWQLLRSEPNDCSRGAAPFVSFAFLQQHLHQLRVQFVAAAMGHEISDQIAAGQRQIADHVEHLVANAFVGETEFIVDRPMIVEHQQVAIVARLPSPWANSQSASDLSMNVRQGANSRAERFRHHMNLIRLPADAVAQAVIEAIPGGKAAAGRRGPGFDPTVVACRRESFG